MLLEAFGDSGRGLHNGRQRSRVAALSLFDALFDIADGVEIFIHLAPVRRTERSLQPLRIFQDKIENAFLIKALPGTPLRSFTGIGAAEQPLEKRAGTDLCRHRGGRCPPGDAVAIVAAIAVVAIAAQQSVFAT